MQNKITAKDFFIQLGAVVTFYASAIALITLLFEVIDHAYPKVANSYGYYGYPSISFQVATLIVAFPLFLFLSWLLQKSYEADPALRETWVRRWLAFITLFIAGGVVAGDLITVIYMWLDGQDLTTGFLLKVLALLVIVGGIFLYYLREIRNVIGRGERNIWRAVALVIVLGSIILGFSVIGSPRDQRERRYDQQRISDLQSIQWELVNYWQRVGTLPEALGQDSISGFVVPVDPVTKQEYKVSWGFVDENPTLKLCADFAQASTNSRSFAPKPMSPDFPTNAQDNWQHPAGHYCFDRTIDPLLYPPIKR